ncbi:hypothetical protein ABW20_dc0110303 [Dactylellina cionopaga]|nr:hypothetical protein ABW20_dc0110303 [Dactylellina cionopaga]
MEPVRRPERAPNIASTTPADEPNGIYSNNRSSTKFESNIIRAPSITIPKGGGAIRSLSEKYDVDLSSGSGKYSIALPTSASRPGSSFRDAGISLQYSSNSGNSVFGAGWTLSVETSRISRKFDRGVPRYRDSSWELEDEDTFILNGFEDLVRSTVDLIPAASQTEYTVKTYHPRIEGAFLRIEWWINKLDSGDSFWKITSQTNDVSIYGRDRASRISQDGKTDQPDKVFSWLLCERYDINGNAVIYNYKSEDGLGILPSLQACEQNRSDKDRTAEKYLKSIKYGNRKPNREETTWDAFSAFSLDPETWMFEALFDYGEHSLENPRPSDMGTWRCREDPYSSYRSGFEVRTYRLCSRVLLFHHLPDHFSGQQDVLVTSFSFQYDENPYLSYLTKVIQTGYDTDELTGLVLSIKSLPPLTFNYTKFPDYGDKILPHHNVVQNSEIGFPFIENGRTSHQWIDLDGEGTPGILWTNSTTNATYYSPNISGLGEVKFQAPKMLNSQPSLPIYRGIFMDIAGNGSQDLVDMQTPGLKGYFERKRLIEMDNDGWGQFQPFESVPNMLPSDYQLIDLSGDGLADIVILDDQIFKWYSCLPQGEGYSSYPEWNYANWDEDKSPRVVFTASNDIRVFLADLSGDGLVDIVRIRRDGEVCYWPNLGYANWGARITLGNCTWPDPESSVDILNIYLADVDGSGASDVVCMSNGTIALYRNQSGNSLAPPLIIPFSQLNSGQLDFVDLFGNGTSCLVLSSSNDDCFTYLDFSGGKKPHLLETIDNGVGVLRSLTYSSSTKFYLKDKADDKPWITRIPFPTNVVESVETADIVSGNRFITRYAYHHGYFDGVEREFRGFGAVDSWDAEENTEGLSWTRGPTSHVKTWFHTGAFLYNEEMSRQFAKEYFGAPSRGDTIEFQKFLDTLLPDTFLPVESAGWLVDDIRQACRSLKGAVLRKEVYGEDLSLNDKAKLPFQVSETNFSIKKLAYTTKPVFFTHERETITYNFERRLEDPRISHNIVTDVDNYGNIKRSFQVAYGRLKSDLTNFEDKVEQENNMILFSDRNYTDPVLDIRNYQAPRLAEAIDYQIHDPTLMARRERFYFEDLLNLPEKPDIDYTTPSKGVSLDGKRKIEHTVTLYRKDDLSGLLPKNKLGSLGLAGESYRLAMTPDIFTHAYQDLLDPEFAIIKMAETGYLDIFENGNYWVASGRQYYSESSDLNSELRQARDTFFTPKKYVDPLGHAAIVQYDGSSLRPIRSKDALENEVNATLDYRVLTNKSITDPNGNTSYVKFDELGRVIASTISGKEGEGDSFARFEKYPSQTTINAFYQDPQGPAAQEMLGTASMRCIYDTATIPIRSYTIARNTHESDLQEGVRSDVQIQVTYTDGLGRVIQVMGQSEPSTINENESQPASTAGKTWICSGWVIYNNKGLVVRKFEPFYHDTHVFTRDATNGVSPYIFYDAMGRTVGQWNANLAWSKITFDAWKISTYDENDTVRLTPDPNDPRTDPDIGGYFKLFKDDELQYTWYTARTAPNSEFGPRELEAAQKAAVHTNTPEVSHLNALGQKFLAVSTVSAKYSDDEIIPTFDLTQRVFTDIEGNTLETRDAEGWAVERNRYNMLGTILCKESSDSGKSWTHQNCLGSLIYYWDAQGYRTRSTYDSLNRPVEAFVLDLESQAAETETMVEKIIYGETDTSFGSQNTRLRKVKHYDQGGLVISNRYDFKGNAVNGERQFAAEYKKIIDHSLPFALDLRLPVVETFTTYDAQNRVLDVRSPTIENLNSTVSHTYNKTGLLKAVSIRLKGDELFKPIVKIIKYNAKGQRYAIEYGNGSSTAYTYDQYTFKLRRVFTRRGSKTDFPDDCPDPPEPNNPGCQIQNLRYVYDARDNVTFTQDDAQQTIFFRGNKVEPSCDYTYDSLYRLIKTKGREHLGQPNTNGPQAPGPRDPSKTRLDLPTNTLAMGTYIENVYYDSRNNIEKIQHKGFDPRHEGWTRRYFYDEPNLLQPPGTNPSQPWKNNRLSSTKIGDTEEIYKYEGRAGRRGNITSMTNLRNLQWNWKNMLQASSQQVVNDGTPETTYYVYDFSGARIRKVTDYQTPSGETPKTKRDRVYVGTILERCVEYLPRENADPSRIEETILVQDGTKRVASIEFIKDLQGNGPTEKRFFRYQLSNYTESSSIELDDKANLLSYEEYFSFGGTSFQETKLETPKRYRFASKERDDETGLDYVGARYYAPWIGRWICPDPGSLIDGPNRYTFVGNNPAGVTDPSGLGGEELDRRGSTNETKSNPQNGADDTKVRTVNLSGLQIYPDVAKEWGMRAYLDSLKDSKGSYLNPPIIPSGIPGIPEPKPEPGNDQSDSKGDDPKKVEEDSGDSVTIKIFGKSVEVPPTVQITHWKFEFQPVFLGGGPKATHLPTSISAQATGEVSQKSEEDGKESTNSTSLLDTSSNGKVGVAASFPLPGHVGSFDLEGKVGVENGQNYWKGAVSYGFTLDSRGAVPFGTTSPEEKHTGILKITAGISAERREGKTDFQGVVSAEISIEDLKIPNLITTALTGGGTALQKALTPKPVK